jgi:branched-chain amino acid transport system permease protein
VNHRQALLLAAVTVVMAVIPVFTSNQYTLSVLTQVLLWAYMATCWNVLGGMAGQLSFGHAIFSGTAAYASAVLFIAYGWNPLLGGALGVVLACMMALAIGYVSARYGLVHLHFALVTTAVGQIALFLAMGWQFIGGATGLTVPYRATPAQLFFRNPAIYYWIFLGMTVCVLALTLFIRHRRMGLYF